MALDPITAIVDLANGVGSEIIKRVFPDPTQAAAASLELAKLKESGDLQRMVSDNELTKAYLADTASARARDIAIIQAKGKNSRGDFLAYMAVGALILCIVLLFIFEPPSQSRDLLLVTLGALVAIVKDVFGFEFGSSKGSERNAQAVADALKNGN